MSREVKLRKYIIEVLSYKDSLEKQLLDLDFKHSFKERSLETAEDWLAEALSSDGIGSLLKKAGILDRNPEDASRDPARKKEIRKIDYFLEKELNLVYEDLDRFVGADLSLRIADRIEEDRLDFSLKRRWEYAVYDQLALSLNIENEETLGVFETSLFLEKWAFRNFAAEIDDNFGTFRSKVTGKYLRFLNGRLQEFIQLSTAATIGVPEPGSPIYFEILSLLDERRKNHEEWLGQLENQLQERLRYQEQHFFELDMEECEPKTPHEWMWSDHLIGLMKTPFYKALNLRKFESDAEFEAQYSLVNSPESWGEEAHKTLERVKLFLERVQLAEHNYINLRNFEEEVDGL